MNRRKFFLTPLAAVLAERLSAQKPIHGDDVVLKAMLDELDRERQLRVVGGQDDAPYFIEFSVSDSEGFNCSAALGALMTSATNRFRAPRISVRVGNYTLDQTNHVTTGMFSGSRLDSDQWPIDDDYNLIRQCLWLSTDRAYKTALESMARKRSTLRDVAATERLPDFIKCDAVKAVKELPKAKVDTAAWQVRSLKLSNVFAAYPEVINSGIDFQSLRGITRLVNNEGSIIRYPDNLHILRGRADGLAPDGSPVRDSIAFQALEIGSMSTEAEMMRAMRQVAENVKAIAAAPIGESYAGPVLFEPAAAAQLLAQIIGDNVRVTQKPLSDPGRPVPWFPSDLETRLNSRILPDWIDVVNDGTLSKWNGRPLLGNDDFDLEGQPPQRTVIVEKGVLKSFLTTRQPIKGFNASTGSARLPGGFGANSATISNLFISATNGVTVADLKKKLIESCQQRNKPYGLLIRKLDYPSAATFAELQGLIQGLSQAGGTNRVISPPVLVFKVFPDGREQLVRHLRFRSVGVRSLKDIVAASKEAEQFDFVNNVAPFALMAASGYLAPTSVISPALLFDDMELEPLQEQQPKLPLVPAPPLS